MKVYVNTDNNGTLNMRAEPKSGAQVLARIPDGTELEVSSIDNDWAKTKYDNKEGYVMQKYLSSNNGITKADLQNIYNKLAAVLKAIEEVLK